MKEDENGCCETEFGLFGRGVILINILVDELIEKFKIVLRWVCQDCPIFQVQKVRWIVEDLVVESHMCLVLNPCSLFAVLKT